jgi:hypothetical protein
VDYNTVITTYMLEMPPEIAIKLEQAKNRWLKTPSNQEYYNAYIG